jgi:prolyl oligopeptidase
LKISPVYNIKKGVKYPDMLQFIGDKDNRVVPFHTYKLTAALQEIADPANPYLVYVESNAGHSVVSSMGGISILQQMAFMYTFIMDRLGMHIK